MEMWRTKDGEEIALIAATWELNKKVTFESLAAEFRDNPVKAWRNFGSVVRYNIEAAIRDSEAVLGHVNQAHASPWDEIRHDLSPYFRGKQSTRYFIHFDLSKNRDATGVAMTHRERSGQVIVDFMLRVEAPHGQDIKFAQLREDFVYRFSARGFHIELVTYDGFQSEESRQVLEEKGYKTDYCSADRDQDAYDTLIEMILSGRLDYYDYGPFIQELEELRLVNGTKYDHPKKNRYGRPGSKDVCDAVACAVLMAIRYELDNPREAPGLIRVHRNTAYQDRYRERSLY